MTAAAAAPALSMEGVRRVATFNWPKLITGLGAATAAVLVAGRTGSTLVAVAALTVAAGTAYLVTASLLVSWWVYDRSPLRLWQWLLPLLPTSRDHWVLVHAGFDEAGPALRRAIGEPAEVVDLSPALLSQSQSLRRARRRHPAPATTVAGDRLVPVDDGTCDAVVLAFVAHEVRNHQQRLALFEELRRVLRPGGRAVLVEHLRDGANAAVFGPGAWHFQPRREWLRLAHESHLEVVDEVAQTPFVRGLALCRY